MKDQHLESSIFGDPPEPGTVSGETGTDGPAAVHGSPAAGSAPGSAAHPGDPVPPGDAPAAGAEIEQGEKRFQVVRVAPSPLPGDDRLCAYLQPV